jgi:hypothetical protein
VHHVRSLGRGASGLRYHRISDDTIVAAAAPLTGVSAPPPLAGFASADSTPSILTSASADGTAAAPVLATGTAAAYLLAGAAPTLFFAPASQPVGAFALVPLY